MYFYTQILPSGQIELLKFPDGRPMIFPFRRLEGEGSVRQKIRRCSHQLSLLLSGQYTRQEIAGRTDPQARASEDFEKTLFDKNFHENSKGRILSYTIMDLPLQNEWFPRRWLRQGFSFLDRAIQGASNWEKPNWLMVQIEQRTREERLQAQSMERKVSNDRPEPPLEMAFAAPAVLFSANNQRPVSDEFIDDESLPLLNRPKVS